MEHENNFPGSPLVIEHFVFDNLSFERLGFHKKGTQLQTGFAVDVHKDDPGLYRVTVQVTVTKEEEYRASAQMTGYCKIDDETPGRETLLNENAPAILLPYIRAQLTLLTAQPETLPAVLPVVNVHEMVMKAKRKKIED